MRRDVDVARGPEERETFVKETKVSFRQKTKRLICNGGRAWGTGGFALKKGRKFEKGGTAEGGEFLFHLSTEGRGKGKD